MARTRQIKNEFFLDDELAPAVSRDGRLLFIGLWTIADREGRLEDRPERIRAMIFPFDKDLTYQKVDALLNELSKGTDDKKKFIIRYAVDGHKYIQIRTFKKHQHCHIREADSTIPAPTLHQPSTCLGLPDRARDASHVALGTPRLPASTSTSASASTSETNSGKAFAASPPAQPPGDGSQDHSPSNAKNERPRDEAYEGFTAAFQQYRGIPYRSVKGDFVELAGLRSRLHIANRKTPDRWEASIRNYLATPQGKYTLADLCSRFDVFMRGALDRFGKPIGENHGGQSDASNSGPAKAASGYSFEPEDLPGYARK